MIIEFTGLPGSGKSTLSEILKKSLIAQGYRTFVLADASSFCYERIVASRVFKRIHFNSIFNPVTIWYGIVFFAHYPTLISQVARSQLGQNNTMVEKLMMLRWFWITSGLCQIFRQHLQKNEVLLCDEGLLHRSINLFTSLQAQPANGGLAKIVSALPTIDLILFVKVSKKTASYRLNKRGQHRRLKDKNSMEVDRFLENSQNYITQALKLIKEADSKIIEVDNNKNALPSQETLSSTCAIISQFLITHKKTHS